MRGSPVTIFALALYATLLLLALWGRLPTASTSPFGPAYAPAYEPGPAAAGRLFVYVHGGNGGTVSIPNIKAALASQGDLLIARYPGVWWSNAEPQTVADKVAADIGKYFHGDRHREIILVGESLGALIVRRAFIDAEARGTDWSRAVSRVVLLAGMNRGWDISGKRPLDMPGERWLAYQGLSWGARLANIGQLSMRAEMGSPFVARLRIDWMARFHREKSRPVEVVQLLGDIDDVVSDEDNKDLRSMASSRFAWVRVRGTGHVDIADFGNRTPYGGMPLGDYRREKFLLAATRPLEEVKLQNEEQPFETDDKVTHVVFVVHGIRDLGEWAAAFEHLLQEQFRAKAPAGSKIAVASIRYGYFGMGPFLLGPSRDKYVKWFMDEYTETLARYPKAKQIHFVGHSNGTYLLAAALERYCSLQVNRVVLGGSVVPRDYPWRKRRDDGQVRQVRNYVGANDWVVALFPRFFEVWPVRALLRNDVGSGGFNGFTELEPPEPGFENVKYIAGEHGAFLGRTEEIVRFLLADGDGMASPTPDEAAPPWWLQLVSDWATPVLWFLLAALIFWVGWVVVTAGSGPRWPLLVLYLALVGFILARA